MLGEAPGVGIVQHPAHRVGCEHHPLRAVEKLPAVGRRDAANGQRRRGVDDRSRARIAAAAALRAEEA
eukprot:2758096-Pleurochrysis_carterae.AAC.1